LLEQLLAGNKGSNILTAILVPLPGAHINFALAWHGFATEASTTELAWWQAWQSWECTAGTSAGRP